MNNLNETFNEITNPDIRYRFQNWLFPLGIVFNGEKFETNKIPLIYTIKEVPMSNNYPLVTLRGIEPRLAE